MKLWSIFVPSCMTVNTWFEYWIEHIVGDLSPNTRRNYRERYTHNIQPVIGTMLLSDVKPLHCKMVFNRMEAKYSGGTIRQAYITMGTMFKSALMNDIIIMVFLNTTLDLFPFYWVGQEVHSSFSIRCYRKIQMNFWPTQ